MLEITPADWLQYGALGLLGLGMFFASTIIYKIITKLLTAQDRAREALTEVLQQNAAALSALQVTVAGLHTVMVGYQHNVAKKETSKEDSEP